MPVRDTVRLADGSSACSWIRRSGRGRPWRPGRGPRTGSTSGGSPARWSTRRAPCSGSRSVDARRGGGPAATGPCRDAAAMAMVHREAMPSALLPTLGRGFLRRLYGAMIADGGWPRPSRRWRSRRRARHGCHVGGRVVPAVRPSGGRAAGLAAAPHLLRPSVLRRAIETARYPAGMEDLPARSCSRSRWRARGARAASGRTWPRRSAASWPGWACPSAGRRGGRQRRCQPVLRRTRVADCEGWSTCTGASRATCG